MSDISSSIAETNRQRIEMGLAPLAAPAQSNQTSGSAASAAASARADEEERIRIEAIRAELARRKEERLVKSKVMGSSLGESLISQTAGSARDWIERSRKLGLSEAEKAAQIVAEHKKAELDSINEDAYTAKDLAGTKIAHDFNEFEKGEQVILTLKDSRILSGVADGLNEDEDELLNQDLAEKERQKEINARRKNLKSSKAGQRGYDVYGEEEAELLSKYSDAKEKSGLRLGEAGTLTANEIDFQANAAIYQQDEARKEMNQLVYSLDDTIGGEKERKFQSDYKEVKFKKKKKTASSAATTETPMEVDSNGTNDAATDSTTSFKKKSSRRVAKAPSASLMDFLPEPSAEERQADLASRNGISARQARELEEERVSKEAKDARYLRAIQSAELKTQQRNELDIIQLAEQKAAAANAVAPPAQVVPPPPKSAPPREAFKAAAGSTSIPPPPPPPLPRPAPAVASLPPPPGLFEEEDDSLLSESLARARRLAQEKSRIKHEDEKEVTEEKANHHGHHDKKHTHTTTHDSIRALAERVKEEEKTRVKIEPGLETGSNPFPAADSSSTAASGIPPPPPPPRLPPGMSLKSRPADGGIVFTATTEFVRGLQFHRDNDSTAARIKKEGTSSVTPAASSSTAAPMELDDDGDEKKSFSVEDGAIKSEDEHMDRDEEDEDDDNDSDDGGFGLGTDEPAASTGVAAALKLFKSRGILKEGGNGRGDQSTEHYGAEKYDAFGHEQSMKEQFRFISHKFHGIEPGLKKQEKRLNRVQAEAQRLQALREQGGVAEKIAEKQKATASAHVVMDKKFTQELATTGSAAGGGGEEKRGSKRKEMSGPFAKFGFGKGGFAKKRKAQLADQAKKQAQAAAAGQTLGHGL